MSNSGAISSSDKLSLHYDGLLTTIVDYAWDYEVDQPGVVERARLALLDALGCVMETLTLSPDCKALIGPVVPGTTVPNGFKLPGTQIQLDPVKGAFDLGALIRYLDHNDAIGGEEWGHPSDNLGAILAVADWVSRERAAGEHSTQSAAQPPMTMRTVLKALVKAYEIQGGLQEINSFNGVGLDHTILVKVASTAVVAWLLGLSKQEGVAALSQAFVDGHPLRTFRHAPNVTPRKGWQAGDACMRAVHLALLTRARQPGAPTVLTEFKWGFQNVLMQGKEVRLKRTFGTNIIRRTLFKVLPAEGHGLTAVEAALSLHKMLSARGLSADEAIQRIDVRTQRPACIIINKTGPLTNPADRDHCLQYMIAVVLLKGKLIEATDYADDSQWAKDPRTARLRAAIKIKEDPRFTERYLDQDIQAVANGLTAILRSGEVLPEVLVEFPIGHAKHPRTIETVTRKYRRNLGLTMSEDRIETVERALAQDDLAVHEFVDYFASDTQMSDGKAPGSCL